MPKMQLRTSPIQIVAQDVLDVSIQSNFLEDESEEFGPGKLDVERDVVPFEENPRKFGIHLTISFGQTDGEQLPPFTGSISLFGVYLVHENFSQDPKRLVRITGASMLYGVARELISTITARSPNGVLTLPSVSFFEEAEKRVAKKAGKKQAKKKAAKAKKS
jgi:preprotein translocase subunit SecB